MRRLRLAVGQVVWLWLAGVVPLVIVVVGWQVWKAHTAPPEPPPPALVCYEGVVGMVVPKMVGLYILGDATICAENWEFHPRFSTDNTALY